MQRARMTLFSSLTALALGLGAGSMLQAQTLEGRELVESLRGGGYVLIMRSASADATIPQEGVPRSERDTADNPLDSLNEEGLAEARELGEAIRGLEIPIVGIHTSPEPQAVQTAEELQLGEHRSEPELRTAGEEEEHWLRAVVGQVPEQGNVLVITHEANIGRAFPAAVSPRAETGEVLIFDPRASASDDPDPELVARLKVSDWEALEEELRS